MTDQTDDLTTALRAFAAPDPDLAWPGAPQVEALADQIAAYLAEHLDGPTALRNQLALMQDASAELAAVQKERDHLARWKDEALTVLDGLQDLQRALDLPLGEILTMASAAQAVLDLRARLAVAEAPQTEEQEAAE